MILCAALRQELERVALLFASRTRLSTERSRPAETESITAAEDGCDDYSGSDEPIVPVKSASHRDDRRGTGGGQRQWAFSQGVSRGKCLPRSLPARLFRLAGGGSPPSV